MFGRLLAASSLFLVAACGQEADVGIISVENAVVTVPAVPGAPGGKHAMVFGLDPAVRVGDRVPLTFRTEGFAPRTVEAEVRGPGQAHASH